MVTMVMMEDEKKRKRKNKVCAPEGMTMNKQMAVTSPHASVNFKELFEEAEAAVPGTGYCMRW